MSRPRFLPDNFTLALIATVLLATFLPCSGQTAVVFEWVTNIGIGLLFFLHGAKLSRQAIIAGMTHWRLHLLVFACTFVMFPLLGLALKPALSPMVTPELYLGILFLCALPATVQSSIAFTSLARGNVPAAVCSASVSSLLGVFLTPLLVKLLLGAEGETGNALDAIGKITLQLLVPFIAGQVLRRWIGAWVERNKPVLRYVDQGSILLVVYTAFSAAVIQGLWHEVPWLALLGLTVACCVILALALVLTTVLARRLGFSKEDEITIVFCGSKKSLATGVPMAKVLFATSAVGPMVLPLMLFHQIQLMVCAVLAQRYARRRDDAAAALAEAREDTRLMFQDSRLLPWKRVIDNVGLGLRGDWRAKALQALRAVGLAERANEWPAALSGGQKQRVALARALIHEPRLLLLDEPLGALDALTRIEMQQLIEGLWREHGFTVLLVTHDVSEAVAVADRVILIEDGEIGLDLPVELPRPRSRGSARLAALEAEVLNRVLAQPELPPQPEPVSPLPTQLRWAL